MRKATIRQKLFAQEYCANGYNATKAALSAGYAEKNARQCASALLKQGPVIKEIEKFKRKIEKRHMITIDQLIEELEEARQIALAAETPQSSAAISATMGKAKLCGLDKQIIDHQSSDGSMTPKQFNDFYAEFKPES